MEWVFFALLGAFFTAMTTILAKIGIKNVNADFATFYRTGVVIIFALILCLISGSLMQLPMLTLNNWIFLISSGVATGISWLCYYKALQKADVSKVTPIDKSSFILTSLLFLIFFFDDTTNNGDPLTIVMLILAMGLMLSGTLLMIGRTQSDTSNQKGWLIYALGSAIFASLVALLVKLGLKGISSDLATLIRTVVVFGFALIMILVKRQKVAIKSISKKSWIFLTLSGVATGGAWLMEYSAYAIEGVNVIAVNSIGKLSIILTMLFSYLLLKEKFTKKMMAGLTLLLSGIVIVIIFSL